MQPATVLLLLWLCIDSFMKIEEKKKIEETGGEKPLDLGLSLVNIFSAQTRL